MTEFWVFLTPSPCWQENHFTNHHQLHVVRTLVFVIKSRNLFQIYYNFVGITLKLIGSLWKWISFYWLISRPLLNVIIMFKLLNIYVVFTFWLVAFFDIFCWLSKVALQLPNVTIFLKFWQMRDTFYHTICSFLFQYTYGGICLIKT